MSIPAISAHPLGRGSFGGCTPIEKHWESLLCCIRKKGWTDRDAVWGLTRVGPMNHLHLPWEFKGYFWGEHVPADYNVRVSTVGECACLAHAVDECIRHREGWQDEEGDAACCQITLNTCYYLLLLLHVLFATKSGDMRLILWAPQWYNLSLSCVRWAGIRTREQISWIITREEPDGVGIPERATVHTLSCTNGPDNDNDS